MESVIRTAFAMTVLLGLTGYYGGGGPEVDPPMTATTAVVLDAVVGPGFTISLKKRKTGKPVVNLTAGKTYKFVVNDKSSVHNFHLTGPSVNKSTTVSEIATRTWTLTLKAGTFKFVCDPHSGTMKGSFTVKVK